MKLEVVRFGSIHSVLVGNKVALQDCEGSLEESLILALKDTNLHSFTLTTRVYSTLEEYTSYLAGFPQ